MSFTLRVKFWNLSRIYFLIFSIENIKSNCQMTFITFFQSPFPDEKFITSQLCLSTKGLIFAILPKSSPISLWFNASAGAYWKHLLSSLLIYFIYYYLYWFILLIITFIDLFIIDLLIYYLLLIYLLLFSIIDLFIYDYYHLYWFIVVFLFHIQSGELLHDPPQFGFIL